MWTLLAVAAGLGLCFLIIRATSGRRVRNGRPTTAVIQGFRPTGGTSGDRPVIDFTVRFTDLATGIEHTSVSREAPSAIYTPQFQIGMSVPILFQPDDPTRVTFDWSTLVARNRAS
ncbi:DUF3592 domain-containing protein [Cellulomonas sp. NPDC089187]|uniref:DUF3592 domain-containing protein n=1 Tax=Cellulomonas sp. NPDC089187 TaxID=3154970 RepID=UPI00344A296C